MPAHGEGGAESDGTVGLTAPEVNDEPADARRARRREDVPCRRRRRGEGFQDALETAAAIVYPGAATAVQVGRRRYLP